MKVYLIHDNRRKIFSPGLFLMWNLLFIRFLGAASFSVTPSLMSDGGVVQRNETLTYTGRDQPGSTVTFIGFGLEQKTISDDSGNWIIHLPPLTGGMQSDVSFHGSDGAMHFLDLVTGDIWIFVGQSNLIFPLHSSDGSHELLDNPSINPKIRLWNEPRRIAKMNENSYPRGAWVEFRAETLYEFSAVASWFAHALSKNIDVPLGVVVAGWGATHMRSWLPRKTAEEKPFLWPYTLQVDADRLTAWEPIYTDYLSIKKSAAESGVRYFATIPLKPMLTGDLFNGMVEGLTRDKIRGIIYYQGESEVYRPQDLRILMPQIIQSYRSYFQQGDIPFLFVQIPGWDFDRFRSMDEILNEVQQDSAMALLREAQLQVDEVVPMTALVTTMDIGEKDDVHPRWKKPVGYRLSQAALSLSYNKPGLFLGPRLRKAEFHGPSVTLTFSHAGSSIRGTQGPLVHGFTVAGSDRMFFPARAEIIGPSTVSVKSESISEVIAVRYGWNDFPASELTDSDGNPAISFRVFR